MVGAPVARAMRVAASGVSSLVFAAYMATAHGAEWTITPSVSLSETFTDNSGVTPDSGDPNSDFITQISPGIAISGRGGRGTINLNYSADQDFYHRGTQPDQLNNNLAATGERQACTAIYLWAAGIVRIVNNKIKVIADLAL